MTARDHFHLVMAARRRFRRGSPDHAYLTRAARRYVWLMRGVPAERWPA